MMLAAALLGALAAGEQAGGVQSDRMSGATRYGTSVAISEATFSTAYEVVLARGDLFPDALVGSYAAGLFNGNGPVLLTKPDRLPASVAEEITRLDPAVAWIIGDETAVSADVEAAVRALGPEIRRIRGATRYDNTLQITYMQEETSAYAVVASGERFPDAMVSAPLANRQMPMVLTQRDRLPASARAALERQRPPVIFVIGGSDVVSEAVFTEISQITYEGGQPRPTVRRISGPDRRRTALAIADFMIDDFGLNIDHVDLARGDGFPDAVSAGPHAGLGDQTRPAGDGNGLGVVLLIPDANHLGEENRAWLESHAAEIDIVHALGDSGVVSDQVLQDAIAAAT